MALYQLRPVRDAMEHIDERLDHIADAANGSLSDWYLSGGTVFMRDPTDPTAGVLVVDDHVLSLFQLDIEMLKLRVSATEAIGEANARVVGRSEFGGVRLCDLGTHDRRLRALGTWEAQRAELLSVEGLT